MNVTNYQGEVMNKDTKELLDLIKLRNNQMQEILKNVKSNAENTTNRINLEYVINNLHTLNLFIDRDIKKLFIDKDIEKKVVK